MATMNPAAGKSKSLTPALLLGAVPLLLANWFAVVAILGRNCVFLYDGGNITECGGGLSEEQMSAVSGLIALAMLVIQTALIVLVNRRVRSGPQ
ncbi:hypothetical protein ACFWYW_20315 [Nonomuraea sp. NPDC059023]|uniref:hypothetical protein n=1 Tax=unclassified Nonomuraea TaxID=2593643 RepID=UPI003675FDEB